MESAPELRVLIVDDEAPARAGLRALLSRRRDVTIVGEAASGRHAVQAIRTLHPSLVLLDVQMPEVSGFDVLREVDTPDMPAVVFVTAYEEFAVRAFEAQAIDYVLKPVSEERLALALDRARRVAAVGADATLGRRLRALLAELAESDSAFGAAAAPSSHPPAVEYPTRVLVRVGPRDIVVSVSDIDWIEADDYCSFLHVGGRRHLVRETLGKLEARLDPSAFVRIHRSAIVRVARVAELVRHPAGALSVVLRDGTSLPVSRSRRARLEAVAGPSR